MRLHISGPSAGLRGEAQPPGDKSISHRALLLSALAQGPSRLLGFLNAGVTEAMLDCLRALGADVEFIRSDDLLVIGRPWTAPAARLDCRNSGATMRMLMGALSAHPLCTTLDGTTRLRNRPMGRVIEPLQRMGAEIRPLGEGGAPPLEIRGGNLHGIHIRLPVASAQVKTAILFAGLFAEGKTTLEEPGPSRDHTERILQSQGIGLSFGNQQVTLKPDPRPLPGFTLRIPGDMSSAAFLMAAGLTIPGSALRLTGVGINETRTGVLDTFREMGASIPALHVHQEGKEPVADLEVISQSLRAVDVHGDRVVRMIDEFPIFAVAATQAEGESTVREADELRHKESDRIAALVRELRKMGAQIEERDDGFVVAGPTRLQGAHVHSHGDHRLAMALTIAALLAEGESVIEGTDVIQESYPDFRAHMTALGAEFR